MSLVTEGLGGDAGLLITEGLTGILAEIIEVIEEGAQYFAKVVRKEIYEVKYPVIGHPMFSLQQFYNILGDFSMVFDPIRTNVVGSLVSPIETTIQVIGNIAHYLSERFDISGIKDFKKLLLLLLEEE